MTHLHGLRQLPGRAVRALIVVGLVMAAGMILAAMSGCAALPPCPVAQIHVVETREGPVFFVDFDNLNAMRLRMVGLHERTCAPGDAFGVDADAPQ